MKLLIAALLLAVAPLSAQDGPETYASNPEQFPGQLARMRLAMLYPKLLPETTHFSETDPDRRLGYFLADTKPVLKNLKGLTVYLREGLRDPRAVEGSRRQWEEAWRRLDAELSVLKGLVAQGEALRGAPGAPPEGADTPEFVTPEGVLLQRAVAAAAYAQGLRDELLRDALATGRAPSVTRN